MNHTCLFYIHPESPSQSTQHLVIWLIIEFSNLVFVWISHSKTIDLNIVSSLLLSVVYDRTFYLIVTVRNITFK